MNELARTGLAPSESDESSIENPVRAAIGSSRNASVTGWRKDEPYVHENPPTLWPHDSPLDPGPSSVRELKTDSSVKSLSPPANLAPSSAGPIRIAIKTKGRILLINPADIFAVEAEGNYVLLRRHDDSYSLREPISSLAEKLNDYGFVRIHRSVLVNSSWVEEIHPGPTGEYTLRIVGGTEYAVSRTYKPNLKCLAQSWIGTDSFADE